MILESIFNRNQDDPHPIVDFNNSFFSSIDQNFYLKDYDFVVFDTELTGMDYKKDEIISIGAVKIRNMRIKAGETFHSYVRPESLEPRDSTLVHRITPQQLKDAPPLDQVLKEFIAYISGALLVGHYVDLDVSFINRAAKRLFNGTLKNPCLDTMRLAQAYTAMSRTQYHDRFNLQVTYNLADLVKVYGLPSFVQHDALGDALQTAYLFLYLTHKVRRHGYATLRELFGAGRSLMSIY
ncbi:PolC-type DNA polymerase III [Thermodesulfobacteriota bacterium]